MATKSESLQQLVGQLFLVGFDGLSVPAEFRKHALKYGLGGVIYFKRNVQSPAQLAELANQLQFECRGPDTPPMIVSIDHEGGKVNRLVKPFTKFPGIDALGEIGSPKLGFAFGAAMAKELKAVGINLNYAPVVDVLTNRNNPVMAGRCFSSDPEVVAKLGSAVSRGIQKMGVMACAKHFPGHGDTAEDSHFQLPRTNRGLPELEKVELVPFRRVTRSRVESIMTAHVINASLDPDLPATLSSRTIERLLRGDLRYNRLVISDDMEMKAIADHYGAGEAAVKAVQAGCDLLIYRGEAGFPVEAIEAVIRAVEKGDIPRKRLDESLARIEAAKRTYCTVTGKIDPSTCAANIGLAAHQELADAIQRREIPKHLLEDREE
jgi:beta-N-acetylhexosaminidase